MRMRAVGMAAWLALVGVLCGAVQTRAADGLRAELVASGLSAPTFVTAPFGDSRLFILERAGRILILDGGTLKATPFLDIRSRVSTGDERGMFGLAFPADFAISRIFYVYYTDLAGRSVVSRFERMASDPDRADPLSELPLLVVPQPFANHNGGTIAFSPVDGYLYFSPGDGGSGNDPDERAQNPQELLGKMLRIDVSGGPSTPYTIPPSNPFTSPNDPSDLVRDEIWAFGLRNPFRFAFDRATGDLWIADVGQNAWEEINREPAGAGGRNYGWDVMEGSHCNPTDPAPSPTCNSASLTLPTHEYNHSVGCAVTGGPVFRGSIAALQGQYVFGDFCSARIWTLDPTTLAVTERTADLVPPGTTIDQIVAFGEDGDGELYIVDLGGEIFRVREACVTASTDADCDGIPNELDPCTVLDSTPPPIKPPGQLARQSVLLFTRLDTPPGDERIVLRGQFNPASPTGIDPSVNGVHMLVQDELGAFVDVDVPGGLLGTSPCGSKDGWKKILSGARTSWKYANVSGALPGAGCSPGSAQGVTSLVIVDASSTLTGAFVLTCTLAKASLARSPDFPVTHLRASVTLAARIDPIAGLVSNAAIQGQCLETEFEGAPVPTQPVPKSAGGPEPFCRATPLVGTLRQIMCKGL